MANQLYFAKKEREGYVFKVLTRPSWWLSGKESPANAGGTGEVAHQGRSDTPWSNCAHAPQLLSLRPGARELHPWKPSSPKALEPVLCSREATAMRSPRALHS